MAAVLAFPAGAGAQGTGTPGPGASSRRLPLVAPVIAGKPREAPPRFELKPDGKGGFTHDDARFTAHVARDGSVSFTDRRLTLEIPLVSQYLPQPHPEGTQTLEGTVRGLFGKKRGRPPVAPPPPDPPLSPTERGKTPPTENERKWAAENPFVPAAMIKGTYDLTDEYYRLLGEDPYRREKARFLAATFERRMDMAARAQVADLRTALDDLPGRLDAIWGDRTQPAPARRRLLCSLHGELARDDKGRQGAAVIVDFVRRRLAAGGPDAYTPAELAACNAGGAPAFAPYGDGVGDTGGAAGLKR